MTGRGETPTRNPSPLRGAGFDPPPKGEGARRAVRLGLSRSAGDPGSAAHRFALRRARDDAAQCHRIVCAPMVRILALILLLLPAGPAHAVEPGEMLADPALEARARAISEGLRCLVCQNQSIDNSDAPLASDLRVLVRERLAAGDSDAAVRAFVVERYGEFVLLKPRLSAANALLWATPLIVLVAGAVLVARRRRTAMAAGEGGLTADEETKLAKILERGD